MQLSENGANLIRSFEQLKLVAYKPTPDDVWTIGWGHTKGVTEGMICTVTQADEWFDEDTAWAVAAVNNNVLVDLNQNQFDALVSICFNIGQGNFDNSTLLRDLDSGNYIEASDQFLVWDKQRGQDLPGLDRRREAERQLFDTIPV